MEGVVPSSYHFPLDDAAPPWDVGRGSIPGRDQRHVAGCSGVVVDPLLVWDGLDLFLVRGLWLRCWPILGRLEPWDPVLGSCHYPFIIFSLISSLLPPFISPLACTALDIVILYHT